MTECKVMGPLVWRPGALSVELLYEELRSSRLVTNIRLSPKISIQMLARETSSAFLWAVKLSQIK
jgi:hypothetical protein